MLSRRQGTNLDNGRAPSANLAIVITFVVVAVLLLTKTWVDSRGISSDIGGTITPQLSAVDGDLGALPVLDRTGQATEKIATQILPIAIALGRTVDATSTAAQETNGIRDDVAATKDSVAGINASTTAILATLRELAPLVAAIASGTRDIAGNLTRTQDQTAQAATALARLLNRFGGIETDTATLGRQARQIEAVLKRIEGHGEHAAAARILQCPKEPRACSR